MKIMCYLLLGIFFISCKNNTNSNYKLIKNDIDSANNLIAAQYYVDVNDTNKKMNIYFWDNGKIMTKAYLRGKLKDGEWEFYSITGKLQSVLRFRDGILIKKMEYDSLGKLINR